MTALLPNPASAEDAGRVLEAHRTAVEAVCFRRLRSRVDAEDAVQETMLRGLAAFDRIEDPRKAKSYLCRIAERVCLDMLRSGARARPEEIIDFEDTAVGPEEKVLADEQADLVRSALQALSARQAEALWMRDALERPVPEVATQLGVTEGSARVLLTRARSRLRDSWAKVASLLPFGLGKSFAVGKLSPLVAAIVPAAVIAVAAGSIVISNNDQSNTSVDRVNVSPGSSSQGIPSDGGIPSPETVPSVVFETTPGAGSSAGAAADQRAAVGRGSRPAGVTTAPVPGAGLRLEPGDGDRADDDVTVGHDDTGLGVELGDLEQQVLDGVGINDSTLNTFDHTSQDVDAGQP